MLFIFQGKNWKSKIFFKKYIYMLFFEFYFSYIAKC